MYTTIAQLLTSKGSEIFSVTPDQTVYDAICAMAERGVGALVVMEGDRLAGIISERDYARKIILKGRNSRETMVRDIMTSEVITVTPERTVNDCLKLMTNNRVRHLPVHDGDSLLGVISIGDLVNAVISDQKETIEHLSQYIAGQA